MTRLAGLLGAGIVAAICVGHDIAGRAIAGPALILPEVVLVSGFAPGGGDGQGGNARQAGAMQLRPQPVYDLTIRLYARHFGRFIPGSPKVLIRHIPGAGSLRAARWLYANTQANGAVLGAVSGQALSQMILKGEMSAGRLPGIVGGRTGGEYICASRIGRESARQLQLFGATAPRERTFLHARAIADSGLVPLKIITGYANSVQIALAFRRGEVDGFCGLSASSVRSQLGDLIVAGKLTPLLRFAPLDTGSLPQIPRASEMAGRKQLPAIMRSGLAFLELQGTIDYALLAPPDMNAGTMAVLQRAYSAMLKDAVFRREAVRWSLDLDPVDADTIAAAMQHMIAIAPKARTSN